MIIKKSQTTVESLGKGKIWDYPMPDEKLGISYQEHNGRAPEIGWGVNTVCHEVYVIVSGRAEIFVEQEKYIAEEGDIVIIEPGKRSYLVGTNVKFLTITQPNWNKEQYQEVG